jgi:mannose-6-phosphate isomerase-like protein (cupin superfamily)
VSPTSPGTVRVVDLADKLDRVSEHWSPKVVAELNGQHVRVAKLLGGFAWHSHAQEDELFLVVHGRLVIQLRDGEVALAPGQLVVIPRGVEHRPVAEHEVHVVLFEPASTVNTGDADDPRRVDAPDAM